MAAMVHGTNGEPNVSDDYPSNLRNADSNAAPFYPDGARPRSGSKAVLARWVKVRDAAQLKGWQEKI